MNRARTISYAPYIKEILSHAGVCYATVAPEQLATSLPRLDTWRMSRAGDDPHRAADHEHGSELSETQLRVRALESILVEKGYVDPAALDVLIEALVDLAGSAPLVEPFQP